MKKLVFIAFTMAFLFSCENELNIDPITEKATSSFFNTEAELESAVLGTYAQLQSDGIYGLDVIGAGEISGEDATEESLSNDGGRFGELESLTITPVNDLVGRIWKDSYIAIQRANTVLNRILEVSFEDEAKKRARIGEMKFVRALMYFNLIRLYGDAPLVIDEITDPPQAFGQGRTPIAEVYAQIIKDLNEAIEELPLRKPIGRPAKGAARSLLADVYLTQSKFSEAISQYEFITNSGQYSLLGNPGDIFGIENEGNAEVLFEVQFATGLDGNKEGSKSFSQFRPSGTVSNAKGHNLPSFDFMDLYDQQNDLRFEAYFDRDLESSTFYYSAKFDATSNPNDGGSDFIVIRYSDVILKYAEALNEVNRTSEARQHLNSIRTRAGLDSLTINSQGELREAIRLERRLELFGEGHRWFDIKRYGDAVDFMNTFFERSGLNIVIDEDNLLLPIPQTQLDTDPAILQNPGY